jgi:hypothetical protein
LPVTDISLGPPGLVQDAKKTKKTKAR